jgi:hypothetical protein
MVNQLSRSARHRNGEFDGDKRSIGVNGLTNPRLNCQNDKTDCFMHNVASFTTIEAVFGDFCASPSTAVAASNSGRSNATCVVI